MEFMDHGDKKRSQIKLLSLILRHSFENGWVTEKEKLRIEAKKTFKDKIFELFKLMQNMECEDNAARLFWSFRCFNEMEEILNETGWDEDQFLSLIVAKVYQRGLISEEEKQSFDTKIYFKTVHDDLDARHPMKIELIIRCVLKFLNVQNIGICRLISKLWSTIALNFLKSRARIAFIKMEMDDEDNLFCHKTPIGFFATFYETSKNIPFTAFRIYNTMEYTWTVEELSEFFDREQKNIRELKLEDLQLEYEAGENLASFDLSEWIADSPLADADTNYNTKLEIDYEDEPACILQIPTNVILGVKILNLKYCDVHLTDEKITPIELELYCVSFTRNGNKLPSFCINDAFDLFNLKRLILESDSEETDYELDLSGNLILDYLCLPRVIMTNWDTCTWTVNRLKISEDPFIEKTDMKIKELHLTESNVDLSVLPQSIEKLFIEYIRRGSCFATQQFTLQNLHYLRLYFVTDFCSSTIYNFHDCPNLVALELENLKNNQFWLNLSWIPQSVKILKLEGFRIANPLDLIELLDIDKLVLLKYSFHDIENICSTLIQTKELVLFLKISDSNRMLDVLEIQNSNPEFLHRIYVGRFNWNGDQDFEYSRLSQSVDFKSEYYLFEQQIGTAICLEDFEKAKNIQDN